MFLTITLAEIANRTILSEYVPESAGLLIFASVLIGAAIVIRKVLSRRDEIKKKAVVRN
jgi:hypothetical protein